MRIQDPKDKMVDYQIRDLPPSQNRHDFVEYFEVSKWDGSYAPVNVYTVTRDKDKDRYGCDCPAAFRGSCKHISMVKDYLAAGRPATFPTLEEMEPL